MSVVVPTFRRPRLLARLLDSLAAQDVGGDHFEVVVADDGSGDETPEVLAGRARPGWRWEARPANRGPAAARNRGVELARGGAFGLAVGIALLVLLDYLDRRPSAGPT